MDKLIILLSLLFLSITPIKEEREIPQPGWCEAKIEPLYDYITNVKVTMYHPVEGQTDDTPDIVADGSWFDIQKASELKWIALSRDLHKRYGGTLSFGDIIYLKVDGSEESGFYLVKDLMNSRFTKKVDILETLGHNIYAFPTAQLYFVSDHHFSQAQIWKYLSSQEHTIAP
jgi:hypothetical protein